MNDTNAMKQSRWAAAHPLPLLSERGRQLVLSSPLTPAAAGTVTIELYGKWYDLYVIENVIHDSVTLQKHPFPDACPEFCKPDESPYVDHVPNPIVVARWAAKNGFRIDVLAWEMMVGRWHHEAQGEYGEASELGVVS